MSRVARCAVHSAGAVDGDDLKPTQYLRFNPSPSFDACRDVAVDLVPIEPVHHRLEAPAIVLDIRVLFEQEPDDIAGAAHHLPTVDRAAAVHVIILETIAGAAMKSTKE